MDKTALARNAHRVLRDAIIPELPNPYYGKVRDNYDLPDGRRIIIASDRISAFDRILAAIPFKGQVLTQTARFWFEKTADICPNHVLAYPDPNVVIGRRLDILPVEIVVRGYRAGTTSTARAAARTHRPLIRHLHICRNIFQIERRTDEGAQRMHQRSQQHRSAGHHVLCRAGGQPHLFFRAQQDDVGQSGFHGIPDTTPALVQASSGWRLWRRLIGLPEVAQMQRTDAQRAGE